MADSVIARLRVILGADDKPLKEGLARTRTQLLAVAAAASALGAAISAAALQGAQEIDRAAKAARRLDSSIASFRALELAASESGVSVEGLANDVQNMNREIASIGISGNAARALERLGLAASDLSGLDADARLALIADRVQALGLDAGQTTTLLRDFGIENREMALLMIQGGDALRAARRDVQEYGLALSAVDAGRIETANDRLARLGLVTQYVGQQLALAVVPALGEFARALTESLREGGALRIMIDGLVDNLDRLATYAGVLTAGIGVRFAGAFVAARLATVSLTGALTLLRGALIRTGIGALIVGAGELVYQFTRLVSGAGGFGNAMSLLGDVAVGVWRGIVASARAIPPGLGAVWFTVQGAFHDLITLMARAWAGFLHLLADGLKDVPGLEETWLSLSNSAIAAGSRVYEFAAAAEDARARAAALGAAAAGIVSEGFAEARAAADALIAVVRSTGDESDAAAAAVTRLNAAMAGLGDDDAGGGKGKPKGDGKGDGKGADAGTKNLTSSLGEARTALDDVRDASRQAFSGLITGATTARDAVSGLLDRFADLAANEAFDVLFGSGGKGGGGSLFDSLFGSSSGGKGSSGSGGGLLSFAGDLLSIIPGFATGTDSAPGGLAWVGEQGRELVNLPRGSQVIPNHRLGGLAQGGAAAAPEIALHVTSSFDANGNFQTAVSRIADGRVQRAAPGIAQQGAARAAAMKQATKKGTF